MRPLLIGVIACVIFLAGCGPFKEPITVSRSEPPDAREVLMLEPESDIFQWDGIIYQADVEWVQDLELTPKEHIGEVLENTKLAKQFQDGTATVLPVGSAIYSTNQSEMYLLVKVDDELRKYLLLAEG